MTFEPLSPKILRQHKGINFVGVSTCFLCYNKEGEYFMAKRSNKARDERGKWELGGGGLKWGMVAEENVRREVQEEYAGNSLKIDFLGYRDVFRQLDDGTPTHWLGLDFAVLVDKNEVKINEPEMFDDSGWFTLRDEPAPLHSQHTIFMNKHAEQIKIVLTTSMYDRMHIKYGVL